MLIEEQRAKLILDLRQWGFNDDKVMRVMESVPRDFFLADDYLNDAYENIALPIGSGQTISQPFVVAIMTAYLMPDKNVKVLEIGTGCGYQTAILSHLFRRVYTIERIKELLQSAKDRFKTLRLHNITSRCADGSQGWLEQKPFPRIIVTAVAEKIPTMLADQLAIGGKMVIPVGLEWGEQELLLVERNETGYSEKKIMPVKFVPLVTGKNGNGRS